MSDCLNHCPPNFVGRWRDWHRGSGCSNDDGKPRTDEGEREIARLGFDHPRVTPAATTPPAPAPIPDNDLDKLGVLLYRSGSGSYVMVIDWRDNAHECFRALEPRAWEGMPAWHANWDALPKGAREYFGAQMAANLGGKGGAA